MIKKKSCDKIGFLDRYRQRLNHGAFSKDIWCFIIILLCLGRQSKKHIILYWYHNNNNYTEINIKSITSHTRPQPFVNNRSITRRAWVSVACRWWLSSYASDFVRECSRDWCATRNGRWKTRSDPWSAAFFPPWSLTAFWTLVWTFPANNNYRRRKAKHFVFDIGNLLCFLL